jgi:hypothetical protein
MPKTIKHILSNGNLDFEFRTTVVPGIHEREDFLEIAKWIGGPNIKYYLQNFRAEKTIDPEFEKIKPFYLKHLVKRPNKMLNHNNDVPSKWQQLLGEASFAYRHMENREIWNDLDRVSVYYDFNTSTGRSRSRGFNLQGTNDNWHVHTGRREDRFVCFDWIAADLCMAAHMSKDQIMLTSFKTDDPYNFICRYLDDKEYNRDECKKVLLKTIYSLDFENPILELFPTFRNWMVDRINDLNRDGCTSSLLGRKYDIRFGEENVEKAKRRVINAQFQGSVAHAMQAALLAIYKKYPDNLFAEKHDSIIMTMTKGNEKKLINDVSEIMLYPLSGWLDDSFRMPHRIHVGDEWEKWKLIKIKR